MRASSPRARDAIRAWSRGCSPAGRCSASASSCAATPCCCPIRWCRSSTRAQRVAPTLNALGARERVACVSDMSRLGDALLKVTGAVRINYAMFGNLEPALHAHVIPRYLDEPEGLRTAHPWAYDWSQAPAFDRSANAELADSLLRELTHLGVTQPMRYSLGAKAHACARA